MTRTTTIMPEIERYILETEIEAALSNRDPTNLVIQLDRNGTIKVAKKQKKLLSAMLRLTQTAAGVAAITILLKRYPFLNTKFKALLTHTVQYVPESTRDWFVKAIDTLREKVPGISKWLPPKKVVQNPTTRNKVVQYVTNRAKNVGRGLKKTGALLKDGMVAAAGAGLTGAAYVVGTSGRVGVNALKWWIKHTKGLPFNPYGYYYIMPQFAKNALKTAAMAPVYWAGRKVNKALGGYPSAIFGFFVKKPKSKNGWYFIPGNMLTEEQWKFFEETAEKMGQVIQ